jgi:AraC-like DNA-binding protein
MLLTEKNKQNHMDLFADKLQQIESQKLISNVMDNDHFAQIMNMSKSSLYQKMKSTVGVTPFEYMRNAQNEKALEMLSDDSYNISEIAYMIGFNDPQYFSRYFRSKFGISPRQYREMTKKQKPERSRKSTFLDKVHQVIEANQTTEDYSLEAFADDMKMSKSTLYRKIKDATGFSPYEYIRVVRIKQANKLLQTSNFDILDVAFAVGFRDVKYFSRCFKEEFGKYPSQIIKERELQKQDTQRIPA